MQSQAIHKYILTLLSIIGLALMATPVVMAQGKVTVSAEGVTQKLDIYVSESKIIYLTKPVDDVTSSNPDILGVEKVRGMDSQISITGGAVGESIVTVKMADSVQVYQVKVSPMPQRLYINIPESKYLSFKNVVEDFNLSVAGVVRVVQPTTREILIEALPPGAAGTRTTLTVYSKGEIYRYYISTFMNRGADLLEIQNAFTSRGYRNLTIKFENDQATLSGSVTTQEELDDAVRIVKQFTPYVIIRAEIGAYVSVSEESEEERVITNNILRISQVKGLTVRVKFAQPTEKVSSTFTRVVGQPALTTSVTDNQTRLTTNTTQLPTGDGPTNKTPVEGTIETVETGQNKTLPEKIFLFGELEDDLAEAKAIRVARTFCPFVVSMVTVKDPIQIRLRARMLTVNRRKQLNVGVNWSIANPAQTAVSGAGGLLTYANNIIGPGASIQSLVLSLESNINYTIKLGQQHDFLREIQEIDLMLTNGQPGYLFRGQDIPYPSSRTIDTSGAISTSASFVSIGLRAVILPLNYERSSQEPGIFLGLTNSDGQTIVPSLAKYFQMSRPIGSQGVAALIDESAKYVDENGLIGMCVYVSVSALESFQSLGADANGNDILAPQTNQKYGMTRNHLRDGQSCVIGGLLDDKIQKTIRSVPGLNKIPIFGFLFENPYTDRSEEELLMTFTPEIVRMKNPESNRMPKPTTPEMMDLIQQQKLIPTVKPVRYDARGVDLRPDIMSMPRSIETKSMDKAIDPTLTPLDTQKPPTTIMLQQTPDASLPSAAPVSKTAVNDTGDAIVPSQPKLEIQPVVDQGSAPAPAPAPVVVQPTVDTIAPSVNNGGTISTETTPPTLP